MTAGTSLTGNTTAFHVNKYIVFVIAVGNNQGLTNHGHLLFDREKLFDVFSIYFDFALALSQINTSSGCFSSSCSVCKIFNHCFSPVPYISIFTGC